MFIPVKISSQEIENLVADGTVATDYARYTSELSSRVRTTLTAENLIRDSFINGTKLQEEWFPQNLGSFDVFLSHSNQDAELVRKFAKWLDIHLGLRSFIDSVYWKYSDKLLRKIDDDLCRYRDKRNHKYYYYYNRRNFTTSNVHCMLSMALMKMINQCELVIFIDSENSLFYRKGQEETPSPWIYEELEMANLLPHKIPERFQVANDMVRVLNEGLQQRQFSEETIRNRFFYQVNIDEFDIINEQMLRRVLDSYNNEDANHIDSLNRLYMSLLQNRVL